MRSTCRSPSFRRALFPLGLTVGLTSPLAAQQTDGPVAVDARGVLRWTATGREVALFGVNYSTPFAHAYRAHGYLAVDRKPAIDADVLHFARLGIDAYRIHVWDREVSDRAGNLVANDHLDLLDYLLARLADYGIKVILTPIAWWPPGYPEPDPPTSGLSDGGFANKGEMTARREAWPAQANYLRQFVAHRNPYTGRTYAEDPSLIAVEIFNEPNHPAGSAETTAYIDSMTAAVRAGGFGKPVFYNISENYSDEHGHAVCAANIQGVSHQWYPSGLVRNGTIGGNMLPNVDRYPIPYADFPECRNKARMVYEFDAADVAGSYMYPAMARGFRAAGFQWATQFAYDPLAMAYANTEYQTHYLNLAYTPSKAVSFLIAGAVFRAWPRGQAFGTYPASERFGPFRVSYADDLSEMVTDTAFYYSNPTATAPPSPRALRHVAGVGTSPVVRYDGSGAYFLDRLVDGVWRLELYPDVAWVVDPFTRPSLDREAARVIRRTRPFGAALPDLGAAFTVEPLDTGNEHRPAVREGTFDAKPGAYLLVRAGIARPRWTADSVVAGRRLGAFAAPPASTAPTVVLHSPASERTAGRPFPVTVDVVSAAPADSVALLVRRVGAWGRPLRMAMQPVGAFGYAAEVAAEHVREGMLEYAVTVYDRGGARTYPADVAGHPYQWDFTGREYWRVPVVPATAPVLLFDAHRDLEHMLYPHPWRYVRFRTDITAGSGPERLALAATVEDLTTAPHHFALRTFLPPERRTRLRDAPGNAMLRIRARTAGNTTDRMAVALVERDGTAWGTVLDLTGHWNDFLVPATRLERMPLALLPRPYPLFLPYLFESATPHDRPRLTELDGLQFAVYSDLFPDSARTARHGFQIERVTLDLVPR